VYPFKVFRLAANLNALQGYTKIVDSRKQEAYRLYQQFLDGKKKDSIS